MLEWYLILIIAFRDVDILHDKSRLAYMSIQCSSHGIKERSHYQANLGHILSKSFPRLSKRCGSILAY